MKIKKETAIKILAAMLTALMLTMFMESTVFAGNNINIPTAVDPGVPQLNTTISKVLGIVQIIAAAAAVIMLIVLGIKYMTADPGGKSDVKQRAIYYVVGAVMLFASSAILGIIKNFATSTIQA